ncbi:7-carboxy-7-deazaguanine synthase QueE [Pseudonocardia sp. ICBG1293]|uniref:7-carboxy-7-deazaguanine synthase QueE n=1 Tax=Pseudonocardia sp. ICBG1293 TaxID=2844382 RepID=UPI001CCA2F04|nr:7-carboxy-7-deazaguanine synthase QueE [Pseudonocardia sp. ICBG1293]
MTSDVTSAVAPVVQRRYPVVELFGPTIQGEGPEVGRPCLFVRFGGCDYRCTWCDSLHAVDPAIVHREARRLSDDDIVSELLERAPAATGQLVILSGGNPAMHTLDTLVQRLHDIDMQVSIETQGSLWKPWLGAVDNLIVSPKPPSSGMDTDKNRERTAHFMSAVVTLARPPRTTLKVVCFDEEDVEFAFSFRDRHRTGHGAPYPLYLSSGTDADPSVSIETITQQFRWLCEHVADDPRAQDCTILPQLHVIAWGQEKGR